MSAKINWFGSRLVSSLRTKIFMPRVRKSADALLVQIRLNIGQQGLPHSKPGEYPRRLTGYLARAIDVEYDESNLSARVFVRNEQAPYWKFLEYGTSRMAPRQFMQRTFREMKPRTRRNLTVG
jgi:HK97 gp10 family phage protein